MKLKVTVTIDLDNDEFQRGNPIYLGVRKSIETLQKKGLSIPRITHISHDNPICKIYDENGNSCGEAKYEFEADPRLDYKPKMLIEPGETTATIESFELRFYDSESGSDEITHVLFVEKRTRDDGDTWVYFTEELTALDLLYLKKAGYASEKAALAEIARRGA